MAEITRTHFSFILRCWYDDFGDLQGVLIEAISRCHYPFRTRQELNGMIDQLTTESHDEDPDNRDENRLVNNPKSRRNI